MFLNIGVIIFIKYLDFMKNILISSAFFLMVFFGLAKSGFAQNILPYILDEPIIVEDSSLYPLVICLHGAGGRGDDNTGRGCYAYDVLKQTENRENYPCYIFFPQCPTGEQWVDTPWNLGNYNIGDVEASDEMEFVIHFIDSIINNYSIDKSRIYVTGQSMGGFGTWDLILRRPELFACAIPVCGGGDTSKVNRIKDLPIWIFHGSEDDIIPVEASREMYNSLKRLNNKVMYTEFEGVKHGSWIPAWNNEELVEWMFNQKTSGAPTTVKETVSRDLHVYPNPSKGEFTVALPANIKKIGYDVYNTIGAKVQSGILSGDNNINIMDHPKGMYILKTNGEESMVVRLSVR